MELVAVGPGDGPAQGPGRWCGRDVVAVPLAPAAPVGERAPMTAAVSVVTGELLVDEWSDPVGDQVQQLASEARAVTAAAARLDARLAQTYVWGAAELAARSGDPSARRRQEWGSRGMLAELAATLRIPEGTLARRLTRITMLAAFPALQADHAAGVASAAHVDAVLDVFSGVTDRDVLARADDALAGRAARLTAPQLRAAARRWRSRHVPRTDEQRRRAVADRFVDVTPADDDLCWLTALLPAAAAMGVLHRIDDLAAAVVGPDDGRTVPQLRADVLCDLLLSTPAGASVDAPRQGGERAGAPAAGDERDRDGDTRDDERADGHCDDGRGGDVDDRHPDDREPGAPVAEPVLPSWVRGVVPQVVLTVPVLSLLGHGDEPAELEGFGPIDLDTARVLCANAPSFTRVLTHPETGAVLSVGRERYTVPADLRRAVALRDQTCRFPGCRRRAARCDVDHSTGWADGGTTDLTNLACLCRKHHRLKHQAGWRVTHEGGGVLRWHSPIGRQYRTRPATALWPPPSDSAPDSPPDSPSDSPSASATHPCAPPASAACPPPGYPDTPPF